MKQGQTLIAKSDFGFRAKAKGRAVQVRTGQRFWVTNSAICQAKDGVIMVDREGKGHISNGWAFTPSLIETYFEVAQ